MKESDALLAGRVVAITGAGGGLGRAYALAAAQAGAHVIVADIQASAANAVAAEIQDQGGDATAICVDISAPEAGQAIVNVALARGGGLDGFVANAGILSPGALLDQSAASVRQAIDVNIAGTVTTVVAAARAMREGGRIVVILSGSMLGADDLALYGTTKAAGLGLVYGLALELAQRGIHITGLAPRARTAMSAQMGQAGEDKGGDAGAVAPAVTYLLSDAALSLNGHVLRFDGERLGLFRPPRIMQEISADAWDAHTIAAALAGPLAEELKLSLPGAARRFGAEAADVLHIESARASKCLGD